MNANELMIGNYVNYQGRAQKICALNMNSVKIGELAYDDHRETLSNILIKPIPLTEDWKDKIKDNEYLMIDKSGFVIFKNGYAYQFIFQDYPFLYQLQNLYLALTQKELTIN